MPGKGKGAGSGTKGVGGLLIGMYSELLPSPLSCEGSALKRDTKQHHINNPSLQSPDSNNKAQEQQQEDTYLLFHVRDLWS